MIKHKKRLQTLFLIFSISFLLVTADYAYAAPPTNESNTNAGNQTTTTQTSANIDTDDGGTATDRILVALIGFDDGGAGRSITSVTLDAAGAGACSAAVQQFTDANVDSTTGEFTTEIWYLTLPGTTLGGTCPVTVTYDGAITRSALGISVFSNVNTDDPIANTATTTEAGTTDPDITVTTDNAHQTAIAVAGAEAFGTITPDDTAVFHTNNFLGFTAAGAYQNGAAGATNIGWTGGANSNYALSAIAISSNDDPTAGVSSSNNDGNSNVGGGCLTECEPPTVGLDQNYHRIVDGGFSYNGHTTDAELFFTPFPLITVNVGEENIARIKVYENSGIDHLTHFELAFGLGKGEEITKSTARIIWDKNPLVGATLNVVDPYNALQNVTLETDTVLCRENSDDQCTEFTIYHTFRKPLDFNIVGTTIWDLQLNSWSNYYNHGVEIVGESMDPPATHHGHHKGKAYQLVEISKTTAVDEYGDAWTLVSGNWIKDYKKPTRQYVDPSFYTRIHPDFKQFKEEQIQLAKQKLVKLYGERLFEQEDIESFDTSLIYESVIQDNVDQILKEQEELAELVLYDILENKSIQNKIKDYVTHDYAPAQSDKITDFILEQQLFVESSRAEQLAQKMYSKIYNDQFYETNQLLTDTDKDDASTLNDIKSDEASKAQQLALKMYSKIYK